MQPGRHRLRRGKLFALYVAAYTAGRGWIEALRIDTAHHFLGLRLNDWVSIVVFAAAVAYLVFAGRGKPPLIDRDSARFMVIEPERPLLVERI